LCLVALLGVAFALPALEGRQAQSPPRTRQHGRLFPPQDLGLLEAPDRDIWQRPDQIMDVLAVADASVVADVGAGSGWFSVRLARRVGPNGIVYAEDVQQEMLAAITRRVQREGLTNVRPVLGESNNPRLPIGKLDAVLLVDSFNEVEDRVTMLRNIAASLKPQGRIGVIDFKVNGGGGPGPPLEDRLDAQIVIKDAAAANLRLLSQETFLPYQYCLVFAPMNAASDATPSAARRSRGRP
jgi:ubiquinone/menaquinone biosynthesis C-methylase UbiE